MHKRVLPFALIIILFLAACGQQPELVVTDAASPTVVPSTATNVPTATAVPPTDAPTDTPTAVPDDTPTSAPAPTDGPPSAEQMSRSALEAALPPARDDVRLAMAYRGLPDAPQIQATAVAQPLPVGAREIFNVPDVVNNVVNQIDAELFAVSDHAYFWFDTGDATFRPDSSELERATEAFDEIYAVVTHYFGPESNPGLDGDPRLHIVHASPISLCGVTAETVGNCRLAGLVNSTDLLPSAVDPRSNEREMFVMNILQFGSDFYYGVLAHEFRHMIEDRYDNTGADWEKEGSATLAAQLAGMPSAGPERGTVFLQNPDQQLNSWTDGNTTPYYGQGYVFNRYLFDQLGEDLYREFATSPLPGFPSLDAIAAAHGLDRSAEQLWQDWLVALAFHDNSFVPDRYRFEASGMPTATSTAVDKLPFDIDTTVSQYAADYYRLPQEPFTLSFQGAEQVLLLGVTPAAGDHMWHAARANYSNPRLTRELDLRSVDSATLTYDVYADIEQGYDFAYVSASRDGVVWEPLAAPNMQGQDPSDNPAGSALSEHFYTGRTRRWVSETVDLSDYAGEVIQLRFEYVTDPILTYGGFAVDNIAVPEIGFEDGGETAVPGWQAEGFTRTTGSLPQVWHLQLITFADDVPQVETLPVDATNGASLFIDGSRSSRPPILVVAATAPMTLETAPYQLELDN